jgi:HAMP domain-containing protein
LILAENVVRHLSERESLAKRVAVADLRETYNNGWNAYDEAQEVGSLKRVLNSQLSEAEFEAKLSLNAINVAGD